MSRPSVPPLIQQTHANSVITYPGGGEAVRVGKSHTKTKVPVWEGCSHGREKR